MPSPYAPSVLVDPLSGDIHSQNPSRDTATKPSGPTALISPSRNPTIALAHDALDAACLGYCPIHATLPNLLPRPPPRTSPAMRRSRAAEIVAQPSNAPPRFHDDAERPRPAACDPCVPPVGALPGASLVIQMSSHSGIPTV
ncbi:hypothetical protein DFH08DRAFT_957025 [Mycena albidolilacea]|uniref:Uncharacterized protein n=1 Tax=Mycena albidolilacea TaxID=1033008 RepID=A0AAD7A9S0_9AGAR|nr:hypothetical protein DFH08DRAFT_957025 [Mycena albidolilacea]